MRKIVYGCLLIGFLHLTYGLIVSFWRPSVFENEIVTSSNRYFYDYAGVFNVRAHENSISSSYNDVLLAAKKSGLDFVVATEVNDFTPNKIEQKTFENVHLIVGGEYSYLDSRIINYGAQTFDHLQGPGRSQVIFSDILSHENLNRTEGAFVLLNPRNSGLSFERENLKGLDGIELLNLKQIWQRTWSESKFSLLWTILIYPYNTNLAFIRMLTNVDTNAISQWDKLNLNAKTYGYYSVAADSKIKLPYGFSFKFPSYETLFSIARHHILLSSELTGDVKLDHTRLTDALLQGRYYLSLDILQNPKGFESFIRQPQKNIIPIGAKAIFQPGQELIISLPVKPLLPFETVIYKNGEKIMTSTSALTVYTIHSPGAYRSVVRLKVPLPAPEGKKWLNWIITNPIFLTAK